MAKNGTTDIELLAGLNINSSEQEILRAIKIIEKRLKANHDARFKLNVDIDETVINNTITKLQNALKNKDLKIETQDSIIAITKEANAMLDVVDSAKRATQEKLEFTKANRQVRSSADDTADAINRERAAMNNLDDIDVILQNINMSARQGGSVFQQFGNTLRDAFYTFTAANMLQDAIYKVIDAGKESVETVKELNDALTSLRMATGESYESVKNLLGAYNDMAQELGSITVDVSESADEWLRQGHSISETNELIKDSMMLSKISNLESADSTKYLTSAMQGYKVAVEDVVGIVDKLSAVDLVSATDAGGLAEAMSRTSEGAQIAGISMDRLLGMIATVGEVTQKSMSSIGESYKTIFSRMRDIKDNKLSIIGDDGEIEDLSNVEIVLNSLEIKLRDSNQEFRNFQEVLDEVASGWNNYTSVQQAAIAKAFSGVRQQENFLVMMENWDKVIEYTEAAADSAGTAEEKFSYYLESIEAKTNSLKASLENLAMTTISDDLYASVLDTSKAIVDMTAETGILKGVLAGLGTAGALYAFQHLATYMRNATQEFANLGEAMQITRNANGTITDIQRLIDLTGGLSESQTRLLLSTNNLTDAQKVAILMNQYLAQGMDDDLARATAEATLQTWGLTTAQQGATGAAITLRNTIRGLWTTMMANPLVLVTAAVTAGVSAFTQYKQKQEEVIRTTKEAAQESADLSDELNELSDKYFALSDAVKDDESAKEDLLDVQDQLIKKLGLEADEIDNLIEKYGSLDEAIKNATISKLQEARHDLVSGYDVAKDELYNANNELFKNRWTVFSKENKDALKVLENKGIGRVTDYMTNVFYLTGNDSTIEGAITNLNQLKEALSALEEEYGTDKVKDIGIYEDLYKRYTELKPLVENYIDAVDDLNENAASSLQFTMLQNMEFPDTTEGIESFRDQLLQTALASDDFVGTQEDIKRAVDSVMKTFSSASEQSSSNNSGNNTSTFTGFLNDDQKKAIEAYKTLMKKISDIKENAEDYSISDLATTFSDYDWSSFINGAESLDTSLRKIASGSLADVRTALVGLSDAEPIIEELRQSFLATFEGNDFGWSENLGHYDFLSNLLKEVQSGKVFNMDELTQIIANGNYDLYGDIKELENGFTIDEDAIISLINKYAEEHNESLKNVREALENSGINPDSVLGKNSYKELIDTGSGSSSSSKSDNSIDWLNNSIENLQENVDDLQRTLDNTKGWEAQKTAIDNLNKELKNLQGTYYSTEDNSETIYGEYERRYKDSLSKLGKDSFSIKSKIEAGDVFNEEEFSSETIDIVNDAIDAWNGMKDSHNKYLELGIKIDENELEKLNIESDHFSSIRENLETELNGVISDTRKLEIYKELEDAISNDYKAQRAIAEAEEGTLAVEKLLLEEKQALYDLDQQRLELNREIEDSEVAKLEQARTQLENQININGSKGTGEQYQELIKNEKLIIEELTGDLEREGKLLLEIESTLGKNSSEYRVQEKVVNDIANEIDECVKRTKDWGTEILNLGLDVVQDKIDGLNDQLEVVEDALKEWDSIIAGAQAYIQDQIDAQEELKKPIEEQLEAMEKANDERERALALDKARYELERARNQRSVKLYSGEEKGFIYTQNQDDIRAAQENFDNLEFEDAIHQLEKQLEYYDEIIKDLQEIKDAWGSVKQNAQDALDIEKAIAAIGINGIMNMSVVEDVTNSYTELLRAQENLTGQIGELQDLFELLQRIVAEYQFGYTTLQEATEKMHEAVYNFYGDYNDQGLSTTTERQDLIDRIKKAQGMESTIEDLIGRMQGAVDRFAETDYSGAENTMNEIVGLVEDFYSEIYDGIEGVNFKGLITDMEPLKDFLSYLEWGDWNSYAFEPTYYAGLISALETVNPEFANMISSAEEASKALEESGEGVAEGADAYTTLEEKVDGLLGKLEELSEATYVTDFSENQLIQLESFTSGMEEAFSTMSTNITDTVSSIFSGFQTQLSDVLSAINSTMSSIANSVEKIKLMQKEVNEISGGINSQYANLESTVEKANSLSEQIGKTLASAVQTVGDKAEEAVEQIQKALKKDETFIKGDSGAFNGSPFPTVKYHTGLDKGYVGDTSAMSDNKRLEVLQKAGNGELNSDELPVVLQKGELVLTKPQQINIADSLLQRTIMPNVNIPDYSHLSNVVQRNAQVSYGDININCPGITSQQVAKQIGEELQRQFGNFRLDALQFMHRRK